jgi:hypothetical protein
MAEKCMQNEGLRRLLGMRPVATPIIPAVGTHPS